MQEPFSSTTSGQRRSLLCDRDVQGSSRGLRQYPSLEMPETIDEPDAEPPQESAERTANTPMAPDAAAAAPHFRRPLKPAKSSTVIEAQPENAIGSLTMGSRLAHAGAKFPGQLMTCAARSCDLLASGMTPEGSLSGCQSWLRPFAALKSSTNREVSGSG